VLIAGSGVLGLMLLMHNAVAALLGAGIVLCGLPVRWVLTKGSRAQSSVSHRVTVD